MTYTDFLADGHRQLSHYRCAAERGKCRPDRRGDRFRLAALLSAASLLEASIVIESRKGEAGGRKLDLLIYRAAIEVVAVDQDQAEIARIAWRRYGKGRHPAGLNYGDCFAYALARSRGLPLLFQARISPTPTSTRFPCSQRKAPELASRDDRVLAPRSAGNSNPRSRSWRFETKIDAPALAPISPNRIRARGTGA